jgi:hypothetical protein
MMRSHSAPWGGKRCARDGALRRMLPRGRGRSTRSGSGPERLNIFSRMPVQLIVESHRSPSPRSEAYSRSVLGMIRDGATHVAVATDHVIESFRNGLWPGYKTGEGIEPDLPACCRSCHSQNGRQLPNHALGGRR